MAASRRHPRETEGAELSYWQTRVDEGHLKPRRKPAPRYAEDPTYPLSRGVFYRSSLQPDNSHLYDPSDGSALCGSPLLVDVTLYIDDGYAEAMGDPWLVVDLRKDTNRCKDCIRRADHRPDYWPELPQDSPISAEEWGRELGTVSRAAAIELNQRAAAVALWLGGEVVGGRYRDE